MTVKADVTPGVLADDKVSELRAWLQTANISPRVEITFKGEDEEQTGTDLHRLHVTRFSISPESRKSRKILIPLQSYTSFKIIGLLRITGILGWYIFGRFSGQQTEVN